MKITVQVKPNSKKESVELLPDGSYLVRVNTPPTEGKANKRTQELLAEFFKRPKTSVNLVSGVKSKRKIFSIQDPVSPKAYWRIDIAKTEFDNVTSLYEKIILAVGSFVFSDYELCQRNCVYF